MTQGEIPILRSTGNRILLTDNMNRRLSVLDRTLPAMDWFWFPAALVSTWFLIAVLVVGAVAFRAPTWSNAFYGLAWDEAVRRGLDRGIPSLQAEAMVLKMAGDEPTTPEYPDMELKALAVLSGSTNLAELTAEIQARRDALLEQMCDRQCRRVEHISTLRWASRIWIAQRFLSRLEVAARGVVWLIGQCLKEIGNLIKSVSVNVGIAGVFVGLAYWLMSRERDDGGPSQILGDIGIYGTIAVILWAISVLLYRLVVLRFGPPWSWPRRVVITTVIAAPITVAVAFAAQIASRWLGERQQQWLDHVDTTSPAAQRVVAALFAVGCIWMLRVPIKVLRYRSLLMSDRLGTLSSIAIFSALAVAAGGRVISDTYSSGLRFTFFALLLIASLFGLLSGIFEVTEWFGRYQWLRQAKVAIPRRGFSWWLVGGWIGSFVTLGVVSSIRTLSAHNIVQLLLIIPTLFSVLGMIPVLIITTLFVRRVNKYYEHQQITGRIDFKSRQDPAETPSATRPDSTDYDAPPNKLDDTQNETGKDDESPDPENRHSA